MESKLKIGEDRLAYEGKFMKVVERPFENIENGHKGIWEVYQRKFKGRIVAVAALTPENELVLIRIFRVPLKSWVFELCAGMMDDTDPSEEFAAGRELLEETGYVVDSLEKVMCGPFNCGAQADEMAVFLGRGAVKAQEQDLESSEDIEVWKIPAHTLMDFLKNPPFDTKIDIKLFGMIPFLTP